MATLGEAAAAIPIINGEVLDSELAALARLLTLFDAERERLDVVLGQATEESPLAEEADHLAGLGFVACQRYFTVIAEEYEVAKGDALAAGPRCVSGATVVSLLNASANAWKHEAEWKDALTRQQTATVDRLWAELSEGAWDYKYVNALYAIAPSSRFADIVPILESWREELRARARQHPP